MPKSVFITIPVFLQFKIHMWLYQAEVREAESIKSLNVVSVSKAGNTPYHFPFHI